MQKNCEEERQSDPPAKAAACVPRVAGPDDAIVVSVKKFNVLLEDLDESKRLSVATKSSIISVSLDEKQTSLPSSFGVFDYIGPFRFRGVIP